jgi:hypothetical protein
MPFFVVVGLFHPLRGGLWGLSNRLLTTRFSGFRPSKVNGRFSALRVFKVLEHSAEGLISLRPHCSVLLVFSKGGPGTGEDWARGSYSAEWPR